MKYFIFTIILLLYGSGCFLIGWILGSSITARRIAEAIEIGELDTKQVLKDLAHQIVTGIYKPIRVYRKGERRDSD
jgi:hypothetical protein